MRIESAEKWLVYIVTEDSFGTAYCIKTDKCNDIFNDMYGNRDYVPKDDAKVFFAAWDGEPINPNKYTDFKSCMEYIAHSMPSVHHTRDAEYIWEVVDDVMFENAVFARCSTEEKARKAVEFLKSTGISTVKILPRKLDEMITRDRIVYL